MPGVDRLASITSRRTKPQALSDRVAAVEHGPRRSRERYQRSVVSDDLCYRLDVLEDGTPQGRAYGADPFYDDAALGLPRSLYRLDTSRRRARHAVSLLRPTVMQWLPAAPARAAGAPWASVMPAGSPTRGA